MAKSYYTHLVNSIEKHRYRLLLVVTLFVLIIPAFSGNGVLSNLVFLSCMSFLFIQSVIASNPKKARYPFIRYLLLSALLIIMWLQPAGIESNLLSVIQVILFVLFFSLIIISLIRFINRSEQANLNVIISSVIIYLLFGIVGGTIAYLFYSVYPGAYTLPAGVNEPRALQFIYFSYVTMSTLGYGDITPARPETQTLSYLLAITGQLYVAIIIAMLVGKYLMHRSVEKPGHK